MEWNYLDKQIIQLWRNHRNQQNTSGCTLLGRQNDFQATSWNQSTAAIHFQCSFCSHSEKLAKWLQTAWQALHKPCTTDQRSCFPRLFNFVSVPNIQMYTGSNWRYFLCFSSVAFYGSLIGALSLCLKWFSLVILSSASEKYLARHQLSNILFLDFAYAISSATLVYQVDGGKNEHHKQI